MTENNQKNPEEKKEQRLRLISYSYTQRFKGSSRDKTKRRGYEQGRKEGKGTGEKKKSPEPCLCALRRPFVPRHHFELADGMNNTFRRSTSNASAAAAIAVYGVCRMSCGIRRVILQRERISIQSVVSV